MTRVLVHEWASGGGRLGRPLPASLVREGRAMRDALVADLRALDGIEVVMANAAQLQRRLASVDAAWVIAPETGGRLATLARRVERAGVRLLGSSSEAIAAASDKQRLGALGLRQPATRCVRASTVAAVAREIGYPVVVKPALGAGSEGVTRVARPDALGAAFVRARVVCRRVLLQRFVHGSPASVSLLCDGRRARVLAVNSQKLSSTFIYGGGETPWASGRAAEAARLAVRACEAHPGLRGYVGVDVVAARDAVFVIEINPRLTSAYLGIRASLDVNVAGLALAACAGRLPSVPRRRRHVRFTAAGRVTPA